MNHDQLQILEGSESSIGSLIAAGHIGSWFEALLPLAFYSSPLPLRLGDIAQVYICAIPHVRLSQTQIGL